MLHFSNSWLRMAGNIHDGRPMTALLVDDEQLAREELGFLLRSFPEVEVVGEAADGPEAIREIDALEPDIVFLDVQMPGLNGLDVVREMLAAERPLPHIIFATAFDHYAVEAFEVNAADYLLKPVEKDRLGRSLQRASDLVRVPNRESETMAQILSRISHHTTTPTKVLVRSGTHMMLVDASDVIFATVRDGTVHIVATELEGHSNYKTLEDLQSRLGDPTFWRPHRSYIVNINRIKEVVPWFKSNYQLVMSDLNSTEIPVSRGQTKRLRELFRL